MCNTLCQGWKKFLEEGIRLPVEEKTHHSNDRIFRHAMSLPLVARQFLETWMPKEFLELVDLSQEGRREGEQRGQNIARQQVASTRSPATESSGSSARPSRPTRAR